MAYNRGDWNSVCDLCGFRYKASQMKKRWDGLMVCPEDFEERNKQEFVRGVPLDKAPYGSKAIGEETFLTANEVTADDL
jgi:hypothetical protein